MPYRFHGQRASEEVSLFTRQHPFILLHPMLVSAAFLLIPFVVYLVTDSNSILSLVFLLSLLAAGVHGFMAWYSWNNTMMMLTTERIVLLKQRGFVHREFAECDLESIQQLSHEVSGLIHTLLGYGDIAVYTGGGQLAFRIPRVPDPYEIQQEILRVRKKEGLMEEE